MAGKAVISLSTGLEDPEKVTVAFLVAVGAAESGRPTLMFQAKEAVRLALDGVAAGVACTGCPPLPDLLARYDKPGGRFMVCPVCFNAKQLGKGGLLVLVENSNIAVDLVFHAGCWYSLISPASLGRSWIRSVRMGKGSTSGSSPGARRPMPWPWWLRPAL